MSGKAILHGTSNHQTGFGEVKDSDTACHRPIIEDDLYSLGLSIWQLYTGRTPHEDMVCDDLGLKERQRNGQTVNVAEVGNPEARDIIAKLLRQGGARI